MPIVSLAALTILDAGPAGQIRAAAEAGFDHVGLRLQPLLDSDPAIAGIAAREREIETLLKETGMKVLEIGVFPIRPDMDIEALGPVLALSHRIGARFIVCPVEDADEARRAATFARLCDLAESCGLEALVEFNPYSACRTLAEADALVTACGRVNARLLIDVLHLSRSGGSPADVAHVAKERIALVHLCDASLPPAPGSRSEADLRAESRTARLYPGEGRLWLRELLAALGPDVPLSIEAPTQADRGLPAVQRAKRAFAATQRFLAANS